MICATSKYLHNVYNEHLPPLHIQLPHHAIASTPTCTRPGHTAGSAKTDSPGLLAPLAWRASQLAGGRAAGIPGANKFVYPMLCKRLVFVRPFFCPFLVTLRPPSKDSEKATCLFTRLESSLVPAGFLTAHFLQKT